MKSLLRSTAALLAIFSLVCIQDAQAQNRGGAVGGGGAFSQLGQTGRGSQNSFGAAGQSRFGQAGAQGRGGQFGGAQGGNRVQGQVGGQDGFVGSNADQIRSQNMSGRQRRSVMFDFAIESLNEMRDARQRRQNRNRTPPVRVQMRPLFTVAPRTSVELSTEVRANLDRAMGENAASTQVTVNGSTATIAGTVGSEYERKLAAKMLSLTPGIYDIDNQLTIEPTVSAEAVAPVQPIGPAE